MKVEKTIHVYASEKEIEIIGNFCALLEEMDEKPGTILMMQCMVIFLSLPKQQMIFTNLLNQINFNIKDFRRFLRKSSLDV